MAKRAPIDVLQAGTVHPGQYLVLVGGAVADVEEAFDAGREVGASSILDIVLLPNIHPAVVEAFVGASERPPARRSASSRPPTVASIIEAADAGLKGARVRLLEIRLADDLGGKGYLLFDGAVADVEAAVEIGVARGSRVAGPASRVIPRLHVEMAENLAADARSRPGSEPASGGSGGSRSASRGRRCSSPA